MAGIKLFGSGGGGGSLGSAAIGGIGGFLTAGPLGAGAGILSGLLGSGDQTSTTDFNYSKLTGSQQAASTAASDSLPALLAQLDPSVMNEFIASLQGDLEGAATTRVEDTFGAARGAQRAGAARSGGMLSTVQGHLDAQGSSAESKALIEAILGSRLTAEQVGQSRVQTAQGSVGAATGVVTGMESTRRLLSQTTTGQGNTAQDMLSGVMGGLRDPLSAFNQGTGGTDFLGGSGRFAGFLDSILNPATPAVIT